MSYKYCILACECCVMPHGNTTTLDMLVETSYVGGICHLFMFSVSISISFSVLLSIQAASNLPKGSEEEKHKQVCSGKISACFYNGMPICTICCDSA